MSSEEIFKAGISLENELSSLEPNNPQYKPLSVRVANFHKWAKENGWGDFLEKYHEIENHGNKAR